MPVAALGKNTRWALARNMASAVARAYNGGLGAEPPAGSRGQSPQWGVRGRSPPESDGILVLEHTFFRSPGGILPVSYTHLTLPTILRV